VQAFSYKQDVRGTPIVVISNGSFSSNCVNVSLYAQSGPSMMRRLDKEFAATAGVIRMMEMAPLRSRLSVSSIVH
jgi:hypothetical protein